MALGLDYLKGSHIVGGDQAFRSKWAPLLNSTHSNVMLAASTQHALEVAGDQLSACALCYLLQLMATMTCVASRALSCCCNGGLLLNRDIMEKQSVPLKPGSSNGQVAVTPHSLELLRQLNPDGAARVELDSWLEPLTNASCGGPIRPVGPLYEQLLSMLHSTDPAALDTLLAAGTPIRVMMEGCKPRPDSPYAHSLLPGLKPSDTFMDLPLHGKIRMMGHMAHHVVSTLTCDKAKVATWNEFCRQEKLHDFE